MKRTIAAFAMCALGALAQRPSNPALLIPEAAPELDYTAVANALSLPEGTTMGAPADVQFDSKGHLWVLSRGPKALFEFDGDGKYVRQGLAHELAHNSVVHLPLPAWLNEGLAILVERAAGYVQRPILDHELRERHLSFWNPGNIQKFWAGDSFQEPTH